MNDPSPSVLARGLRLVGNIEGSEDLVLAGDVEGTIRIEGEVTIEGSARIRGEVHGRDVRVRGTIVGDVYASESIVLEEEARVVGDLTAPRVSLARGARLRGQMKMTDPYVKPRDLERPVEHLEATPTVGTSAPMRRPPPPVLPVLRRARARFRDGVPAP